MPCAGNVAWESRSLPGLFPRARRLTCRPFSFGHLVRWSCEVAWGLLHFVSSLRRVPRLLSNDRSCRTGKQERAGLALAADASRHADADVPRDAVPESADSERRAARRLLRRIEVALADTDLPRASQAEIEGAVE